MNILGFIMWLAPMIAGIDDALAIAAIAAIIGGATTATVGAVNAAKAKRAKRAADRTLGGLNAENSSNYYADYYRGALENDSTRAYLKRLDAAMKKNNRALDNTIVSTGATQENALAQKQAKNAVMSDAMGQAVSAEDARRDRVRNAYFSRKSQLTQQQMQNNLNYSAQQQANRATIASGVAQAASAFANLYGSGAFGGGGTTSAATSSYAPIEQDWKAYNKAKTDDYFGLGSTTWAKNGGKVKPIGG